MKREIATRTPCPPEQQPSAGSPFVMLTLVRLKFNGKAALQNFSALMDSLPEVLVCIQLAGEFDFLLQVVLPGAQAYEAFLREKLCAIPSVDKVESSLLLKAWKIKTLQPLA